MLHHPCILGGPQQREQNRKSKPTPGVTMMHHATKRGFKDCPKCAPLAHPLKGHRWGTGPKRCPARARRANVPPEHPPAPGEHMSTGQKQRNLTAIRHFQCGRFRGSSEQISVDKKSLHPGEGASLTRARVRTSWHAGRGCVPYRTTGRAHARRCVKHHHHVQPSLSWLGLSLRMGEGRGGKPRGKICHKGHHARISFLDTKYEHDTSQGGVFAQRGHSANYHGDYPGNNPENNPPAESCTTNSKPKNSNI